MYNIKGSNIAFTIGAGIVFLMVSMIIYISYVTVGLAIEKNGVSPAMYFPIGIVAVIFPMLLYKSRQTFLSGKMLLGFLWMMASASVSIILLYIFLALITK